MKMNNNEAIVSIDDFVSFLFDCLGIEILESDYGKNFAEFGVDSLRMFTLIEKIEKRYQVKFDDVNPYDFDTLEKLYTLVIERIEK